MSTLKTSLIAAYCPTLGKTGYTVVDRTGRGQHASLTNAATDDWFDDRGFTSLRFDGGSGIATVTRLFENPPSWSVTWWQNLDALNNSQTLVSFGSTDLWFHAPYNTNLCYYSKRADIRPTISATAGAWQHVAIVETGAVGKLYFNGVFIADFTGGSAGVIGGKTFQFGYAVPNVGSSTRYVGDIGIFRRALTAPEIWQLYQSGRGGLGQLLTPQRRNYAFSVPAAAVKSYLFTNRGQVIGGGTL